MSARLLDSGGAFLFMNMETLTIKLNELEPHPSNPRIAMRQDVIDGIVAGLTDGFKGCYALQVWPKPQGGYYILSGHHRAEAAKKAGIEEVPCFVRDDLSEDEAYMVLVTANAQGELSPLEIGMHALHCVGLAKGGRGQKGGLSEYAEKVGKDNSTIGKLVKAATVARKVGNVSTVLTDKVFHLSAIHALPESVWPEAVATMLAKGWSAKETAEQVKASEAETEKQTIALFTGKTTRRELDRIKQIYTTALNSFQTEMHREKWKHWFDESDPVDVKELQAKRIELEDSEAELIASMEEKAEEARPTKPQLVLADPPWKYDFAQSDSRQIENQYPSATVDEIIAHRPETEPDCVLFLWATVAKLQEAFEIISGWGFEYKTHAVWDKQKIGMGYWFRGQHELLLVATKGKASPPAEQDRVGSIFSEARGKHSAKPECVYQWIESAFPELVKLEMYCRQPRDGWLTFGNESK